jgi:hypothetical protein
MIGDTFSSCLVSMPMDAPPTFTPERSLCGMGTTSEAIPRTTNTTPIQNKPLTVFSFVRGTLWFTQDRPGDLQTASRCLELDAILVRQSRKSVKCNGKASANKNGGPKAAVLNTKYRIPSLRPFAPARQVFFLLRRELVDLYTHGFKLEPCHFLVQIFRYRINFLFQRFVILGQILRG